MNLIGLIILLALGAGTLRAQDAAEPSVDLYSGEKQPETAVAAPREPSGPDLPAVSQLDQAFKQTSLGKKADETRLHIEWRQLRNKVANDPAVRAAEAATHTARTDLEKRKRVRAYYEVYYGRMSALASALEMKLALEELKKLHVNSTSQPRVRASTDAPSPTPTKLTVATVKSANGAGVQQTKPALLPSQTDAGTRPDTSMGAALNLLRQTAEEAPKPEADIVVSAQRTGQLNRFLGYLRFAGKTDALKGQGPYTIFAPSDAACNEASKTSPAPMGMNTLSSPTEISQVVWKYVSYYVINGDITSDKLTTSNVPTLNGASLAIKVVNGQITVNDAHVIKADLKASNGVIHIIDKVLVPPTS